MWWNIVNRILHLPRLFGNSDSTFTKNLVLRYTYATQIMSEERIEKPNKYLHPRQCCVDFFCCCYNYGPLHLLKVSSIPSFKWNCNKDRGPNPDSWQVITFYSTIQNIQTKNERKQTNQHSINATINAKTRFERNVEGFGFTSS